MCTQSLNKMEMRARGNGAARSREEDGNEETGTAVVCCACKDGRPGDGALGQTLYSSIS